MEIGIAKTFLDHGQPFEDMADLIFHRHADPAMELDAGLADRFGGFADLHLGC